MYVEYKEGRELYNTDAVRKRYPINITDRLLKKKKTRVLHTIATYKFAFLPCLLSHETPVT